MTAMPEALRLADALENLEATGWGGDCFALTEHSQQQAGEAAAELRRLARVEAQRDALLEALKTYGWHTEDCPQHPTYAQPENWPDCTCGFDDAIRARGNV